MKQARWRSAPWMTSHRKTHVRRRLSSSAGRRRPRDGQARRRKALAKRRSKHGAVLPGREASAAGSNASRRASRAATFDTRFDKPAWIVGSAAKGPHSGWAPRATRCSARRASSSGATADRSPKGARTSRRLGPGAGREGADDNAGDLIMKSLDNQVAGFDSLQFLDGASKRVIKAWIEREERKPIPWTPLRRPLSDSRVALISSAGVALKSDRPFDEEGERQNYWWSGSRLPRHPTRNADRGRPSAPPAHRALLRRVGPGLRHAPDPARGTGGCGRDRRGWARRTISSWAICCGRRSSSGQAVPAIIQRLRAEAVDAVLLVPV